MTTERSEHDEASAGPSAEAPCNKVLDEIAETLGEGIKPDGDPQAALDKLGEIIEVYETSDLVHKSEGETPLTPEQRSFLEERRAVKADLEGLQGPEGDPAEGKR